jgi:hypothetical protein
MSQSEEERKFQEYYNSIQSQVPPEMWGFMAFYLGVEYTYGAFKRNVPANMIASQVINEFNKADSARVN